MSNSPIMVWNETAISLVQNMANSDPPDFFDQSWRSTGPAARLYALLNVAMHDALAGVITGSGTGRSPQLQQRWITSVPGPGPGVPAPFGVFAAIGAGFHLLDSLFDNQERKNDLGQKRDQLLNAHPNNNAQPARRALAYGESVAKALLTDSRWGNARNNQNPPLDSDDAPGLPRNPEPIGRLGFGRAGAAYRNLTPFVMDRSDRALDAPPPPDRTSQEYARDWREVHEVGNRETRNNALNSFESKMAEFWSGGAGTSQETGFWLEIARAVVEDRGLSLPQQTQVMTAVAVANCDAMVSSWNSKWNSLFWRPLDAIRRADEDGNQATVSDAKWLPYNGITDLNGNPVLEPPNRIWGGSPEYTSGTATFAGACSTVLARLFGDAVTFTVEFQKNRPNRNGPMGPHTFDGFSRTAQIAADARIWSGIHFRFSGSRGLEAGRRIGHLVIERLDLKPISSRRPPPQG
jgi:hypothetical protein